MPFFFFARSFALSFTHSIARSKVFASFGFSAKRAVAAIAIAGVSTASADVYFFSGDTEQIQVPIWANSVEVKLWGAGGGGGTGASATGGGGAFVSGLLPVTGGETLKIEVGERGIFEGASNVGGGRLSGFEAGSGGGASTLLRGPNILAIAGGGGGGSGAPTNGAPGGAGGLANGSPGGNGSGEITGGGGGTQSAGGVAGNGNFFAGGSFLAGGIGGFEYGGGGAGGYYGGGGGGSNFHPSFPDNQDPDATGGGGGGGSSYYSLLTNFHGEAGSGAAAGGTSDSDYLAGYGAGGATTGGHGLIVLNFSAAAVPEPASLSLLAIGAGALMLRRRKSN